MTQEHKTKEEVEKGLAPHEHIEENWVCPDCGGILVTNYGPGIEVTFCVDCDYDYYDYD